MRKALKLCWGHVFGQPIDLSALKNFKHQSGCKLVFDAALPLEQYSKSVDDFTG